MNVTSHFDFSSVVIEREQTVTLLVRVKAPPAVQAVQRRPLNLGLVLDRSGSMGGQKIEYLRMAAEQLVTQLTPRDKLSIVIFDDQVETIVPPQPVSDKEQIRASIGRIFARANTNLSGGWLEGLAHVRAARLPDGINRVLLLTDGLANAGVTEPQRLAAIGAQHRAEGISTTTLGFGADFNEDLLSALADQSGGAFYFIENPDKIPSAFQEELGELLKVVGQNMTVEFRGRPPARFISCLNRYPTDPVEGGLRIRVGDLFAEEQREILAELYVPGLSELGPRQVGEITVSLDQVVDPIQHYRIALPIEINIVPPEQAPAAPDPQVAEITTLMRLAAVREQVIAMIRKGEFEAAERVLVEAGERLRQAGQLSDALATELTGLADELLAARERPKMGSKGMFYKHYRQMRGKGDYRKS